MASGDYTLGLEPCTSELDERFSYAKIDKQSKIEFKVELKMEER